MKHLNLVLAILLALGFIFFGAQKFGATNPIFSIIAERSGLSFFEPGVRMMTGVAEIITALLLLVPATRRLGSLAAVALLAGAIGFHLSPWLGISVPGMGHMLFIIAVTMMVLALALAVRLNRKPSL